MRALVLLAVTCSACSSAQTKPTATHGPEDVIPAEAQHFRSCDDAPLVEIDQLEPGTSTDGARVSIVAVPEVEKICTEMMCREPNNEGVCCNHCGGGYNATNNGVTIKLAGLTGCGGMDCAFHCEPFGTKPKWGYRFVGIWSSPRLTVEKFCRLEP